VRTTRDGRVVPRTGQGLGAPAPGRRSDGRGVAPATAVTSEGDWVWVGPEARTAAPRESGVDWPGVAAGIVQQQEGLELELVGVIRSARASGASWGVLGKALGVTPQAVQKRYGRACVAVTRSAGPVKAGRRPPVGGALTGRGRRMLDLVEPPGSTCQRR